MAFARIEREAPSKGFEISWPGAFPFIVSRDLCIQEGLYIGQELSEDQFYMLKLLELRHQCKAQAMRYLAMREHTRLELILKLQRKGFEAEVITPVLDALAEENLQSDYRYAYLFIEGRLRKRSEGRALMAQRLAAKGVDRASGERALDELYSEELVRSYVLRAIAEVGAEGEAQRAHLYKRGFSSYEVRVALQQ